MIYDADTETVSALTAAERRELLALWARPTSGDRQILTPRERRRMIALERRMLRRKPANGPA